MGDLLQFSLQELLDVEVSATTKSDIKIQRAPGVVRVFTATDIARYQFSTLQEVLMNVPGVQINEYRAGHQMIWTRGVQGRYNNKILLLIDGVPVRDSYYGHFAIDAMLPLSQVEKIEIINGPGSALYGTNAFASVIKITTKSQGRSASAAYGSDDTAKLALAGDYLGAYGYLDLQRSNGFSPARNLDGEIWPHPQDSERTYALLKYGDGPLQASLSYTDYRYPERYKEAERDYHIARQPRYVSLGYSWDWDSAGRLSFQAYAEQYGLSKERSKVKAGGILKSYGEEYLDTALFGTDFDYSLQRGSHALTAGLSWQQDRGEEIRQRDLFPEPGEFEPNLLEANPQRQSTALFLQDVWALDERFSLTAGLRYEWLSDFANQFDYRLGATAEWGAGFYGKLLYGTAFRAPSYREYLDVLSYNHALAPEHLKTLELQAGYRFARGDVNLSLFFNAYDDFIGEINVERITLADGTVREIEGDEMAFNFASKKIAGLELYGRFQPVPRLDILAGASYLLRARQTLGDLGAGLETPYALETRETEIPYLSRFNLNLALAYTLNNDYTLGGNLFYGSARRRPPDYQQRVPEEARDASLAGSYVRIDAFVTARLSKRLKASLKVSNLFDQRLYSPPFGGSDYDLEWPGREYRGEVSYCF